MRRRLLLSLTTLTIFAAAPARAQAPDPSVSTSEEVRRGFAALELYKESGSYDHAAQAARLFATAVKANGDDAWAHFGLGLTLARARKTMAIVRTLGAADGEAINAAARSLDRALELDPDFVSAAQELELIAEQAKNRKAQQRAFEVLERHGMLTTEDNAQAEEEAFLLSAPANASEQLRRARLLFARGSSSGGADSYFAGVKLLDEAAAAVYVDELSLIATPQELISVTDGTLAKRAEAVRLFWKKRAVRDGVSVSERLAEHYRRMAYARTNFAVRTKSHAGRDVMGKPKTGIAAEMDDRGLIYIRFGAPTESRDFGLGNAGRSQTWAYLLPEGRHDVYRFVSNGLNPPAYHLEPDMLKLGVSDPDDMDKLVSDLVRYDPRYAFIAARMQSIDTYRFMMKTQDARQRAWSMRQINERYEDARRLNDRITFENNEKIFMAFQRDAAHAKFARPLTVFHDFATFRGRGCTDVVYTLAAEASSYRVNVAVADTFTWEMQGIDTTVAMERPEGGYVRTTGVLCATPDYNSYLRFTVSTDSLTGVTAGGELRIPDYSDRLTLLMSDMLFATAEPGPFVRGNARLALVPPRQFTQNEAFRIFYELYNLKRGDRYRTEIAFKTVSGNPFAKLFKGRTNTTVAFEDAALTDDVVQEIRTLIPEIEPGKVQVTIKVTELATGQTATATETIWILAAEKDD